MTGLTPTIYPGQAIPKKGGVRLLGGKAEVIASAKPLAATNKYLAQSNKSCTAGAATKKHSTSQRYAGGIGRKAWME